MIDYMNHLSTTEIPLSTYARKAKTAVEVSVEHFEYKFHYILKKSGKKKVTIFFRLPDSGRAWFFRAALPLTSSAIAEDLIQSVINRIASLKYEADHLNQLS